MTTTISNATLTVTITEAVTINGVDYGDETTLAIGSIDEVSNRIVNVDTSAHRTLLAFSASIGTGQYIVADVKYLRITNLDDTNYAELIIKMPQIGDESGLGTAEPSAIVKLEAGKSFMLGLPNSGFGALSFSSLITASSFAAMEYISAKANTAAVDLQVFVACA